MLSNQQNNFNISFSKNSLLVKLIYVNIAVFLGVHILRFPFWLMTIALSPEEWVLNWFAVPADLYTLLIKPWSIFSYMFLHVDFFHVLFNMLWLYFLGQLFVEFLGEKKLWTVYIAGGVAGALLYIIFFNLFPVFENAMPISKALGASASVMAIVAAVGTYAPDFTIRLMFLGNVKLKYIAIILVVLDFINISDANSGGHIAHIGGAILGFLFAREWKKGKDITSWVNTTSNFLVAVFKSRKKSNLKVSYKRKSRFTDEEFKSEKKEEQAKVDEILDKISKSGYDSLSKAEKEFLFKASNKN